MQYVLYHHPQIVKACFECRIVNVVILVQKNDFGTMYMHIMQWLTKTMVKSKSFCGLVKLFDWTSQHGLPSLLIGLLKPLALLLVICIFQSLAFKIMREICKCVVMAFKNVDIGLDMQYGWGCFNTHIVSHNMTC